MNRYDNPNDKNKMNRDPITGQPGSHPVGTGAGAAAGGAAGAAIGSAAGPVGTGVGAVAGAVAGGMAGHAAAEHFNPTGASDLQRYLDYTVVDRDNNKVGSVDAVWEDHTGQPAYVAVKTGWLGLGKAHVVPAQFAEVSDTTRKIRLPYTSEMIKSAPSFEDQHEIDLDAETRVSEYYREKYTGGTTGLMDAGRTSGSACDVQPNRKSMERTARTDEDVRIPLSEEHVNVSKRDVEAGGVRLRKIIRTETVNQPIELQREEVVIERVPAGERTPTRTDVAFREEEVYIPLRREEAVVEKTTRTREEVRVGKKKETERRDVTETVRREDIDIQRQNEPKKKNPLK